MPFAQPATLKFRLRALKRLVTGVLATFNTCKMMRLGKNFVDVLGVICPVRCNIERTPIGKFVRDQVDEFGLHDAAFVMPLFWPRVGEVEIDT